MTFWEAFFRVLERHPRKALAALYWHATRRRVRARNLLRLAAAQARNAYEYWVECVEDLETLGTRSSSIMASWSRQPTFSVLLVASPGLTNDQVRRVVASLERQFYRRWELLVLASPPKPLSSAALLDPRIRHVAPPSTGVAAALMAGISASTGDFVVPLTHGQCLSPAALFRFAEALQAEPQASILFGDEDELDAGRRTRPWFKPQWDPDMFLAQDYVTGACALDARLAGESLPAPDEPDSVAVFVLLLLSSRPAHGKIVHVPHVLSHVPKGLKSDHQSDRAVAVANHARSSGIGAVAGLFGTIKVVWPLPATPPKISIIIPTRDKVDLLRACVESVLEKTRYPNFELLVVDNGTRDPAALDFLSHLSRLPQVSVIAYDQPYNYSAINNFAAAKASGPFLCLLNNDTEVIEPDWLTEMMRYAVRPEVGAVGAKLLYDDGSIQHAGVIIGVCEAAGHAHRFTPSDQAGYFAQAHIVHQVSAVTAACLIVEKRKFEAVGGLDEQGLAIAYNDVDLCLKLERAGWRNIYVPHAVLIHHESKSRGNDVAPENIERYMKELRVLQERWGTRDYADPRLNPNLDRYNESFILKV